MNGKPGISSYDKFAIGHSIRSELRTMGGNLLGLNSTIMKLSNGDDDSRASLDERLGAREVTRVSRRQIGRTVSSNSGGVGPKSTPARTANLLGNPYMRRYEGPGSTSYNFGLPNAPAIGEYYDVYESEQNHVRFLDETVGRDLFGYTHLENAAIERSQDAANDEIYLRSTYSVFEDPYHPFDAQDVESFALGPKKYSPVDPYVLKPLENNLVRRTMNGNVQGFKDKFEAFIPGREPYRGPLLDAWDYMGSHYYLNLLNGVAEHGLYDENYENEPRSRNMVYNKDAVPQSDYPYFLDVVTGEAYIEGGTDGAIDWENSGFRVIPDRDVKGLLNKTNRMFYEGKIKSLANRFATLNGNGEGIPDFLNTATDHIYGLSRGRNLRKLNLTNENGYPNPYCRVWTTHYQYSKFKHLIRGKWETVRNTGIDHYTLHKDDQLMRPNKGYERLKAMTSLDTENGRPIFTPYYVNDRNEMEKDSLKRCMFSIENLAWKDIIPDSTNIRKGQDSNGVDEITYENDGKTKITTTTWSPAKGFGMTLTKEQRGPNGGRIMWFPPYNLKFSEQVHANWNPNEFIGRGEKIYSYINSERTGTLSFTVLVDHPSIVNEWARGGKMGKTANKTSPLSKDEMILRYFAGCDSLEFNPRGEYDVPHKTVKTETTELITTKEQVSNGKRKVPRTIEKPIPNPEGDITFYSIFFYPNDYACEDFNKKGQFKEGLDLMFTSGQRTNGVGYEMGNGKDSTGMTYNGTYYRQAKNKNGEIIYWYYPVDSRVQDEVLTNPNRYKDIHDFGLNTDFFGTFWSDEDLAGIKEEENNNQNDTASTTGISAIREYLNEGNTDIPKDNEWLEKVKSYLHINVDDNKYFVPAYNFYKNLSTVVKKLDSASKNGYKYKIDIQGFASVQGYGNADEVKPKYVTSVTGETSELVQKEKGVLSNEILAENRAAVIEGWIRKANIFDFGKDGNEIKHAGNGQVEKTNATSESEFMPKIARAAVVTLTLIPTKTIITQAQTFDEIEDVVEVEKQEEKVESSTRDIYDTSASDDYVNQTYDDEYAYFKQINENDDMVKRYISDKVDYFDPAFHSITPEGFNARLTFLQQCVRQGPTISASDLGMGSAYGAGNLSFGRAPFCVLRIGDFFNTKICIQSINIEYDNGGGVQWDLNPEGVGLQPMFANVNITFTFLGGSDISGPIARLQNAASFNYYANTSVYDRRSDYREGFITPQDDTSMTWSPVLLNKNEDANVIEHIPFYTKQPKGNEGKIKKLTDD